MKIIVVCVNLNKIVTTKYISMFVFIVGVN